MVQLTSMHDYCTNHSFHYETCVSKETSLLFNILSRFVTACLSRSKRRLISWLQSQGSAIPVHTPIFLDPTLTHCYKNPHQVLWGWDIVFQGRSLVCLPLSCEAIKLSFSTSSKTLSLGSDSAPAHRPFRGRQIRRKGKRRQILLSRAPKSLQVMNAAMKLKDVGEVS